MRRSYRGHLLEIGRRRSARVHTNIFRRVIGYVPVAVARMHVAQFGAAAPQPIDGEDALEGRPEFRVEYRIDDRVEGGIRVAQPRQDLERLATDAGFAKRGHDVHTEERHPADEEHAHDDAHRDSRLVIGHMVRRRVVQVAHFELFLRTWPANAAIAVLLFFRNLTGTRDGSYRLDVLLGVAVEPGWRRTRMGLGS